MPPFPSRVFFYSSGSLHFGLSGRVFFCRGSLQLISLFLLALVPFVAENRSHVRGAGAQDRVVSYRGYLNALVESSVANKDTQVLRLMDRVRVGKVRENFEEKAATRIDCEIEDAICVRSSCPRSLALSDSAMSKPIQLHAFT